MKAEVDNCMQIDVQWKQVSQNELIKDGIQLN